MIKANIDGTLDSRRKLSSKPATFDQRIDHGTHIRQKISYATARVRFSGFDTVFRVMVNVIN